MRVEFTADALYENIGVGKGHLFQEGEVYDFEPAFAQRWFNRLVAVAIKGGKKDSGVGSAGPFEPIGGRKAPGEMPPEESVVETAEPFAVGDRVVALDKPGVVLTVTALSLPDDPVKSVVAEWVNADHAAQSGVFLVEGLSPYADPTA